MSIHLDFKEYAGKAYCGRIVYGDYTPALKKRVALCIAGFRLFEQTGNPAIPYISAWHEDDKIIWYEFVSRRFVALLNCEIRDLADTFRKSIIERRVYKHHGTGGPVQAEVIQGEEINSTREGLRDEGEKQGLVEAIYKVSLKENRVLWLKDQANVERFEKDGISISLGCLTDVSKEMEAEETLKCTENALQRANQKLQELVTRDGLTGIANRRQFDTQLIQEWRRLGREGAPLSIIMCDIDHFKLYNDTYGHQAGDDCLRTVARAISQAARRPADLAARYGGEEFVVILPNTGGEGALQVAREIGGEVRRLKLTHRSSPVGPCVTLSLGAATAVPKLRIPPERLVACADEALYQAKEEGRDRVIARQIDLSV